MYLQSRTSVTPVTNRAVTLLVHQLLSNQGFIIIVTVAIIVMPVTIK